MANLCPKWGPFERGVCSHHTKQNASHFERSINRKAATDDGRNGDSRCIDQFQKRLANLFAITNCLAI